MMRRRLPIAARLLVLLGCLVVDAPGSHAQAPPPTIQHRICLQEFARVARLPPIPIGCEIIDCCPGCPGREAITWRIQLGGDSVESMVIEFDGLPAGPAARRTLEGEGRWLDDQRLEIRPGLTTVRGLPRGAGPRTPVAVPRIGRVRSDPTPAAEAARTFDFSVEQFVGLVRVNELRIRYGVIDCVRPPIAPASDVINLTINPQTDNAVVLLDARRSGGCANDEVWRGPGVIPIGNALSSAGCPSEVAVFSNHHAMQLVDTSMVWTDLPIDKLTVPLAAPWQVPVAIFVVKGPYSAAGGGNGDAAHDEVARANDLYGPMNCGLAVQATVVDATANPSAPGLLTRKCSQAGSLRQQIGFAPGQINVYYIEDVKREEPPPGGGTDSVRGAMCGLVLSSPPGDANWNTILVSTLYKDAETLAHEIGHAFSLGHANLVPGMPATNVMYGTGVGRNGFTEGQCFRVNVNKNSTLNLNGVRTGPIRMCADGTTLPTCPALTLDVDPNN